MRWITQAVDHHQVARRRAGIELAEIDARSALGAARGDGPRSAADTDVEFRDRAEQVRGRERAGLNEVGLAEIGHRHTDGDRAANERAGDEHLLGDCFLGLRHLGLRHLLGLRGKRGGQGQERGRT